jgi:hypothetical protein
LYSPASETMIFSPTFITTPSPSPTLTKMIFAVSRSAYWQGTKTSRAVMKAIKDEGLTPTYVVTRAHTGRHKRAAAEPLRSRR